ncbi:hypothetical protein PVAND_015151 [Polypedilum vanderplanki]|uniref:Uncharacterized protein n=1 Tax=Polypedilum vanderplanki TaxID=319348 RepID=A0A9J6BBS7_POLVA|nr:hypothetical protein PVAND_015151 [Polypedilum vanderplanki]
MFTLKKFLFCFELEIGAYCVAAYCSITSLLLLIFLATLLYNANVIEVVKISICVIFVSYYILTSVVIVQNVLVRKTGILNHFMVLHGFMTCLLVSAGIILLEAYNSLERLLPFLADVTFRIYALLILYSIHKKYAEEEKEKLDNAEIQSAVPSENLSNAEAQVAPQKQSTLDRYAEIGSNVFAGFNLVVGIVAMPYFMYCVFTAYINSNELKDSLVLLAIASLTTILALILFVGISQRNSTFVLPMLIVNAILLIVTITAVILPTMINDPGPPEVKLKREDLKINDKLPHFSALMIVAWVFLILCVWSLNDKFKSEEHDKKVLAADKEAAVNYGTNEQK